MVDAEKTGLLFRSGDVEGLIRQLKRVLSDDELCRELGAAAAEIARKRHWPENVAKETMAAYRYILENEVRSQKS
jgi:glycosyltransferase involved in cell wall biosynthesis